MLRHGSIEKDLLTGGGTGMVLDTVEPFGVDFKSLFNRSENYAERAHSRPFTI